MITAATIQSEGMAAELARALGGRRSGRGWLARCPAHCDRHPSLTIADGADSRLLLCCFAGCSWSAIRTALEARSLWPERGFYPPPAQRLWGSSHGPCCSMLEPDKFGFLKRVWRNTRPALGTVVEIYLRSRSLTTPVPPTLRYARLRHRESGRWLPCMVAAVQGADGRLTGLHRTYLQPDGRGKADVKPAKKMLGACRGGAVRLTPVGRRLALCEGIETGLSIREACPDLAIWCALSAGSLDRLTLPPEIQEVVLVADGDPVGEQAATRAKWAYLDQGVRVQLVLPPAGQDINDVLRRAPAMMRAA
jgi:putative DNA primase/helicase